MAAVTMASGLGSGDFAAVAADTADDVAFEMAAVDVTSAAEDVVTGTEATDFSATGRDSVTVGLLFDCSDESATPATDCADRAECAPAEGPADALLAEDAEPEDASAAATPAPARIAAPIPSAATAPPVHPA
jgi:hypothetical protein